jgi:hypothetical protein
MIVNIIHLNIHKKAFKVINLYEARIRRYLILNIKKSLEISMLMQQN